MIIGIDIRAFQTPEGLRAPRLTYHNVILAEDVFATKRAGSGATGDDRATPKPKMYRASICCHEQDTENFGPAKLGPSRQVSARRAVLRAGRAEVPRAERRCGAVF
jgi:hypothetical protein